MVKLVYCCYHQRGVRGVRHLLKCPHMPC
eukprot:COSAG01_NODE_31684_length_593_cov_0.728745_2_plen_28_part_01